VTQVVDSVSNPTREFLEWVAFRPAPMPMRWSLAESLPALHGVGGCARTGADPPGKWSAANCGVRLTELERAALISR